MKQWDENACTKEKIELEYAINKIDNILTCDDNVSTYIASMENDHSEMPSNIETRLKENILKHLKQETKKVIKLETIAIPAKKEQENQRRKLKPFDILRVAACTVFAVLIWQVTLSTSLLNHTNQERKENKNNISMNINNVTRSVGAFMMKPINLERREK